jgi:hypothetical protein
MIEVSGQPDLAFTEEAFVLNVSGCTASITFTPAMIATTDIVSNFLALSRQCNNVDQALYASSASNQVCSIIFIP